MTWHVRTPTSAGHGHLSFELENSLGLVIVDCNTSQCRPDAIDPALRRPGRFDRECYFGLPSQADRVAIFHVHTARCAFYGLCALLL